MACLWHGEECTMHDYLLPNPGYIRQPLKHCSEMTTASSLDGSDSLIKMFSCHGNMGFKGQYSPWVRD